ncbi:MAG: helix-turn-helix domain-containing protein [bacterium]|nr:helix-turn-helix domain-containing protein [bacterium]
MSTDQRFLNKRQVAAMLGLSLYTIDAWVSQRRELPFIKMGRRVMFDRKDVDLWLERNRNSPSAF